MRPSGIASIELRDPKLNQDSPTAITGMTSQEILPIDVIAPLFRSRYEIGCEAQGNQDLPSFRQQASPKYYPQWVISSLQEVIQELCAAWKAALATGI